MKRSLKDWLVVLISLLDDFIILTVLFLVLLYFKIRISLPLIIFIALFYVTYVWLMHRLIVPALRRKVTTGQEGMIGLEGKAMQTLNPDSEGIVKIKGEYWQARTSGEIINAAEVIVVTRIEKLTLIVQKKNTQT